MAYNAELARRVSDLFAKKGTTVETKKMMGGLCYLVDGKMCVGVSNDHLMVRFDPVRTEEVLTTTHCRPMNFTGKTFKGFALVELEGTRSSKQLIHWIDLALEFNPRARRSKKSGKRVA